MIATGGTACAVAELCEGFGAMVVGLPFLVELSFLKGRERLGGREARSLIGY